MWLEHYQNNILQNEEIKELDLNLILHHTLYVIQLLSYMFHFSIEDNLLIIEKDIGIGNVTITPDEFLYTLQFNVRNEIKKELIAHTKNYDDLEKVILTEVNNNGGRKQGLEKIIEIYFPKWKEKNIQQGAIERFDYKNIFYNYYRKEYKIIESNEIYLHDFIRIISNDYQNTLKNIEIYLKVQKDIP